MICKICLSNDTYELIYPQKIFKCNYCGCFFRGNQVDYNSYYIDNQYWYKLDEELKLHQKARFVWFENYILQGKTIEFGAADGDFIRLLRDKIDEKFLIVYSELVDMLRNEYINLKNIKKFIGRIDEYNGFEYSNVFLIDVIEHLDDIRNTFSKIYDMLSIGGRCFISTNNGDMFDSYLHIFYHQEHTVMLTRKAIEILCNIFSLNIVRYFIAPQGWIFLILEKEK